jgi:hypothetical protein
MTEEKLKRVTVYFEPELLNAIRMKAAHSQRSISELVNDAVREALLEDQGDLAAFDDRAAEPTMSFDPLLENLKANAKR